MNLRKYNLTILEDLFNELQTLAQNQHTTVADHLRRFIKLGHIASKPGSALILKQGDREQIIRLL